MPSAYSGSTQIAQIYSGATQITEVYHGGTLVWAANYRLTQGREGTNSTSTDYRGFDTSGTTSGIGSVSPTTLGGATLTILGAFRITIKGVASHYFSVRVTGERSQNFFTSVTESSLGTKTTSSVDTFTASGGVTTWTWNLSGFPTNWDGSGVLTLDFV